MPAIPPNEPRLPTPDRMREVVAEYVAGLHQAYVRQASMLAPGVQGRLPLMQPGRISVAAVGTRYLHLVGTRETVGSAIAGTRGDAAFVDQSAPPLSWRLSFFDPVILPGLGMLDERRGPAFEEVRRLLGVRTHVYHLALTPPAELASHHAGHAGAALAGSHAAAAREYDAIRAAVGGELGRVVDELEGAEIAGLPLAAALLAGEIAPDDEAVARLSAERAEAGPPDVTALRKAVLHAVRSAVGGRTGA